MVADRKLLEFVCPLCTSNHALHVSVSRPNGEVYRTEFYQCAGCSVMFRDIDHFTKLRRARYDAVKKRIDYEDTRTD
jgi:hypothetical protein